MGVFETERLRLRQLGDGDAAFLRELVNEPAWLRFIGDKGVRTLDDARDYIRAGPVAMYARVGFGLWLVEVKEPGVPVGICGLIDRDELDDVDLGFAFLADHRGVGYAVEAARATVEYGRATLGLGRIVAVATPDNVRSHRLLEKLGFSFERLVRLSGDADLWLFAVAL